MREYLNQYTSMYIVEEICKHFTEAMKFNFLSVSFTCFYCFNLTSSDSNEVTYHPCLVGNSAFQLKLNMYQLIFKSHQF